MVEDTRTRYLHVLSECCEAKIRVNVCNVCKKTLLEDQVWSASVSIKSLKSFYKKNIIGDELLSGWFSYWFGVENMELEIHDE
jgi:hypothetical protein